VSDDDAVGLASGGTGDFPLFHCRDGQVQSRGSLPIGN